uniref:Uncharacterized protein n=1 Tax=Ditylum brightwellii TaxID=49249 RepID=A0A7S4RYD2_9STRA
MTWMEKQQVWLVCCAVFRWRYSSCGGLLLWGEFSMMEMVLMQAMHVYSIGMEMPGHHVTMMEMVQRGNDLDGEDNAGHARVFHWNGNAWAHSVALSSHWNGNAWAQRGDDLDGEAARWKSNDGNGNNAGRARVFHWNGNAWAQRGGGLTWMEKQYVMGLVILLRCLRTEII